MNIYTVMQHRYNQINRQVMCFWIFLIPAFSLLLIANYSRNVSVAFSQGTLFILGWISWTFGEYIVHRFWMHNRPETGKSGKITNHQYHHTHPTEIKITDTLRLYLLLPGFVIMIISFYLQNYFTIFTGLYAGLITYLFMHMILHRKWSARFFPRLLHNHILHHCRFPNKCFGITVTWWDIVFNTSAPKNYKVPEKIINYYFGETQKINNPKLSEIFKIKQTFYNN